MHETGVKNIACEMPFRNIITFSPRTKGIPNPKVLN